MSLTAQDVDARLMRLNEGVECALRRAKVWSKYAKDVMTYVEKRAQLGRCRINLLHNLPLNCSAKLVSIQ